MGPWYCLLVELSNKLLHLVLCSFSIFPQSGDRLPISVRVEKCRALDEIHVVCYRLFSVAARCQVFQHVAQDAKGREGLHLATFSDPTVNGGYLLPC